MKTNVQFWPYLAQVFLGWKMLQTEVVEETKTYILGAIIFFSPKIVPFMR
jgi:hypothetical protein